MNARARDERRYLEARIAELQRERDEAVERFEKSKRIVVQTVKNHRPYGLYANEICGLANIGPNGGLCQRPPNHPGTHSFGFGGATDEVQPHELPQCNSVAAEVPGAGRCEREFGHSGNHVSVRTIDALKPDARLYSPHSADTPHNKPLPILLNCPACGERHVDRGEFATKVHHTHACQHCGMTWRPAIEPTVGVQFLPGFKDEK